MIDYTKQLIQITAALVAIAVLLVGSWFLNKWWFIYQFEHFIR